MNMLTGMLSPSKGTALVANYDVSTQMALVRSEISYCPQHDIIYDTLTIREHLSFYGKLKKMSKQEIDSYTERVLKLLVLDKEDQTKTVGLKLSGKSVS